MINKSKIADSRMWEKWRKQGTIGTMSDAILNYLKNKKDLKIYGILNCHSDLFEEKNYSILFLGEKRISKKSKSTKSLLSVLAPGLDYKINEEFSDLPKSFKIIGYNF